MGKKIVFTGGSGKAGRHVVPHLVARGSFSSIADGAGEFVGVNAPWKMSDADTPIKRDIPSIGAHREDVLSRMLELSSDEIAALANMGAFGASRGEREEKQQAKS